MGKGTLSQGMQVASEAGLRSLQQPASNNALKDSMQSEIRQRKMTNTMCSLLCVKSKTNRKNHQAHGYREQISNKKNFNLNFNRAHAIHLHTRNWERFELLCTGQSPEVSVQTEGGKYDRERLIEWA